MTRELPGEERVHLDVGIVELRVQHQYQAQGERAQRRQRQGAGDACRVHLEGRAQPDTDGRAGRKSLELILGIYESAKTGREVPLPLRARV